MLEMEQNKQIEQAVDLEQGSVAEGQSGVQFAYNQTPQEVKSAMYQFQKRYQFKKNWIYTVLLGVLFAGYLYTVIKNPTYKLGVFLTVLCAVLLVMIWLLPYQQRRAVAKAADLVETDYTIEIYADRIVVPSRSQAEDFTAFYADNKLEALETAEQFVLMHNRANLFALPKRCMDANQQQTVRQYLEQGLKKLYEKID